jgi:uncharacterized protein involved in exopolysaccharide biosynthesis
MSAPLNSDLYVIKPLDDNRVRMPEPSGTPYAKTAFLRLLWENRPTLYRWIVWGVILTTIIVFLIPKQYESATRLMPPDDQSGAAFAIMAALGGKMGGGGGGGGAGIGGLAGDLLGLKSSGALFIGILKSRTVEDHLIEKFDLRKVYWTKDWEPTRQKLAANTLISEDRKSGILTIQVTDHSPQRAAAIAEEYVSELNIVVNKLSTSSARRERIFLEERIAQVKKDLEVAEKDFSQFANKTGAIDIKEQAKAMMGAAATLQGQLIAAQAELEGMRQIYTDNNVRVRSVEARVATLHAQLNKLGGVGETGQTDEAATTEAQSDDKSLYPSFRKLPLLGVSYADLYRRAKVQEAVFETLTQQYELAKVSEAKEIPSVKVLDPAIIPERKSFPPRLMIMILGAMVSLCLGACWVFARNRWNQTDSQDPRKVLSREVFQTVNTHMPWATPNGSRFQAMTNKVWTRVVNHNSTHN